MVDVTVKRIEDMEKYHGPFEKGQEMFYAGKSLGITAWGMNILKMPPNWQEYPEHDHAKNAEGSGMHMQDDEEECYVALEGTGTLYVEGQSWRIEPGMLVRVGPATKRKFVPGSAGMTLLALGAVPSKG
jgi:mannose-6-phosphate isomerase-like protein (cupin superfamily)